MLSLGNYSCCLANYDSNTGLEERVFWQEGKISLDVFIIIEYKGQMSRFYAWAGIFAGQLKAELQYLVQKLLIEQYYPQSSGNLEEFVFERLGNKP